MVRVKWDWVCPGCGAKKHHSKGLCAKCYLFSYRYLKKSGRTLSNEEIRNRGPIDRRRKIVCARRICGNVSIIKNKGVKFCSLRCLGIYEKAYVGWKDASKARFTSKVFLTEVVTGNQEKTLRMASRNISRKEIGRRLGLHESAVGRELKLLSRKVKFCFVRQRKLLEKEGK